MKNKQKCYSKANMLTADPEHGDGGLVELDEDSVVDLAQSEELEDLLDLGGDLVDAPDAHHEGQLRLGRDIVAVVRLVALLLAVLLHVLLGAKEHLLPLGVGSLQKEIRISQLLWVLTLKISHFIKIIFQFSQ